MRASRLLSLVLLLQNRGRLTADELAEELGVSPRTIYRDIDSLSSAGIPVYGDAGHRGGYQLLGGYRTRLTGLHADEAESSFLAGLPGAADDLGLGEVLTAAQLKLAAALPAPVRDRAGRIRERFHLDALGWYREQDSPPALVTLAHAVWNQRRIRVRYRRWAEPQEVERELARTVWSSRRASGSSSRRRTARCGPIGCRRSCAWTSGRTASNAPTTST